MRPSKKGHESVRAASPRRDAGDRDCMLVATVSSMKSGSNIGQGSRSDTEQVRHEKVNYSRHNRVANTDDDRVDENDKLVPWQSSNRCSSPETGDSSGS